MCILVGSALASAGAVMQSVFRNPMAEPFILGISSGAGLGAIIGTILAFNVYAISIFAFFTSILAVVIVYLLAKIEGQVSVESLLLAGIAVNFFLYSLEWLLLIKTDAYMVLSWLVGYFGGIRWVDVKIASLPIIFGVILIGLYSRELNVLLLGDESAHYLGVDVKRVRKILIALVSLITAISTAFVGLIGFVGLMVPHIMRLIVGGDNRVLIPSSALFGAIFLTWADTLTRTLMGDIPVGIITMLCGSPFFLYLLRKKHGTYF